MASSDGGSTPPPAGQRIALTLEYDGSAFNGWQLQHGSAVATLQSALEQALSQVAAAPIRVHCAGRTDAGVHATNQVVHFDAPHYRDPRAWLLGVNANLPATIAVRSAQQVAADFHARFSARARCYRYLIHNRPVRPALAPQYLTWIRQPLALERMHEAAQSLPGEHDFSAFRAASCQSRSAMRRIDFIRVSGPDELVVVEVQANAFLHHMVRNIVGALLEVGKSNREPEWLADLLAARDRRQAAATAPANGLYLVRVSYPPGAGIAPAAAGPFFLPCPQP